jgi:5'(3')-deoxyribonucleotidase
MFQGTYKHPQRICYFNCLTHWSPCISHTATEGAKLNSIQSRLWHIVERFVKLSYQKTVCCTFIDIIIDIIIDINEEHSGAVFIVRTK